MTNQSTEQERKLKAIEFMKKLNIYKPFIEGFVNDGNVCFYENFGGFWVYQEAEIEAKMREIIQGGATTILVSHSVQQVRELCNKVLWLEKGEQVAFGETGILCDLYQRFLDRDITLQQAKVALIT